MQEGVSEQEKKEEIQQAHLYDRRFEFTSQERVRFQVEQQLILIK